MVALLNILDRLFLAAVLAHEEPSNNRTETYHEDCHFHDYLLKDVDVQEYDYINDQYNVVLPG